MPSSGWRGEPRRTTRMGNESIDPVLVPVRIDAVQVLLRGNGARRKLVLPRRVDADLGRQDDLALGLVHVLLGEGGVQRDGRRVTVDVEVARGLDVPGHGPEQLEVV